MIRLPGVSNRFSFTRPQKNSNVSRPDNVVAKKKDPRMVFPGEDRFVPFSEWVEKNFYQETSVNKFGGDTSKDWDFSAAKTVKLHDVQKRICDFLLTPDKDGYLPYTEIVYSTIKKEGKTTLASMVGAWWSACMEPPNLILCLANDQEQSAGRIFGNALPTLKALGCNVSTAISAKPEVRLKNGTIFQAIANNYAGAAGANYGLTLWSELWAYTTERSMRLWEELVQVPTRKNSIRWTETYVGFEDESELLLSLFTRIFTDTTESQLQPGVEVVPELADITSNGKPCCYHIPSEGLFYYHNHTPRMGPIFMGTQERYDQFRKNQKATLRPSQYTRLWENYWQQSEGTFINPEWLDDLYTLDAPDDSEESVFALDGSQRNDTICLVGAKQYTMNIFGQEVKRYKITYFRIWEPSKHGFQGQKSNLGYKKGDMDIEALVSKEIVRLKRRGIMNGPLWYDPTQLHQVAMNLRKKGIACVEFDQGSERTKADTFFAEIIRKGDIDFYWEPTLISHIKNAKAKELPELQLRLVKGTIGRGNKIDAAVATSMAVWKSSQIRPTQRKKTSTSSRSVK